MRIAWLTLITVVSAVDLAYALRDHQQCHRIKDPLALTGVIDVATSFGVQPGCKIGKAKLFCDPAGKTVVSSNVPVQPVSGRGVLDGRICYVVRCKPPYPAADAVADQFGARTLTKLRPRLLCTPAVAGPPAPLMDNLDHLECFRATDDLRLKGVVGVDTLDLGVYGDCSIGRSKLVCVPASTTVQHVSVSPELPLVGTGMDDPRVCYTVRCPRPYPGPRVVSDRFGSRTVTALVPKLLCTPSPTSSTTTVVGATSTTSSTLPSSDPPLACQRALEMGGMAYAHGVLDQIAACTAPGGSTSLASCMATGTVTSALDAIRTQWGSDTASPCSRVDLQRTLGYPETCGAAPSTCTFASPERDKAGVRNDVLDCLACRIEEQLQTSAQSMYAGQDATEPCRDAIGNGALGVLRTTLDAANTCMQDGAVTSVASCWTPDFTAWRAHAIMQCAGVNPFTTLGYSNYCSGTPQTSPNSLAPHALPCSINVSTLDTPNGDNDLLDCATCQANEGALGVARDLFGANLCCIGGTCNRVLTRFACRRDGGRPARYRITTIAATGSGQAHGIATAADGSLYFGDLFANAVKRVTPAGAVSTVVTGTGPRGVAVDAAGNVYTADGCSNRIYKRVPGGAATVIAGTGVPGSTGDGGSATAAQIVMPDGIDVDAAGNVYFTESGLLGVLCTGSLVNSERVRMIDTSGNIHTIAGGNAIGVAGEGGPATNAQFSIPYGLRLARDGSVIVGEAGGMRVLRVSGGTLTRLAGSPLNIVGYHAGFGGPAANVRFYENCGIAVDVDGNVLVAMMEDNRIALLDSLGSAIVIAGTGEGPTGSPGLGDGAPAVFERVQTPEDVAVAPDGTIYSSDLGNGTLRVITRELF